jgi:hypothetical protein
MSSSFKTNNRLNLDAKMILPEMETPTLVKEELGVGGLY